MSKAQSTTLPEWVPRFFKSDYAAADMQWPPEKQARIAKGIIHHLGLRPGEHVLDQCCGEGFLAEGLAREGIHVYGVDQSEEYIQSARARDIEGAEFATGDAARWQPPRAVQGAVNWHTSLGYGGRAGARALLGALRAPVDAGRCYLLELRNHAHYFNHHPLHFTEQTTMPKWGKVKVERTSRWEDDHLFQDWKIMKGEEVVWEARDTSCWHPPLEDLAAMVEALGDRVLNVHASIEGDSLHDTDPRMLLIARKAQ